MRRVAGNVFFGALSYVPRPVGRVSAMDESKLMHFYEATMRGGVSDL